MRRRVGAGALDPASALQQQALPAWRPLPTLAWAVGGLAAIGVLFIGLGAYMLHALDGAGEHVVRYDGAGTPAASAGCQLPADAPGGAVRSCTIVVSPSTAMRGPVAVLYQLSNFNQNHRLYVKSRLDANLRGEVVTDSRTLADACSPLVYAPDGRILHPCGLIAQSWFNGAWWSSRW